ncbi:hypothetical protein [Roseovarius phycicola]|uniref:Uncharacterized protein n=1 Tax=Roseovarius phycicola TaxID=3080976 RepID=A0ABZ2HH83_9RHOB
MGRVLCLMCVWLVLGFPAAADMSAGGLFHARQPLIDTNQPVRALVASASLFVGDADGGLFAALPGRLDAPLRQGGTKAAMLRDLIASAEAGHAGYNAVQHGARKKPAKRPTDMTLQEIYTWIKATPGQPHAIGRYQFIPATLRHSAARLGLAPDTRFSPNVQDTLADLLLGDAGFLKVQKGDISPKEFMHNLAKIWAGLPTASGQSYYHGVAGNKAVLSWETYANQVRAILKN